MTKKESETTAVDVCFSSLSAVVKDFDEQDHDFRWGMMRFASSHSLLDLLSPHTS